MSIDQPRWHLRQVTPPTALPFAVQGTGTPRALQHLKLDTDEETALLELYAGASVEYVEHWLGRAIMAQTWRQSAARFPAGPILLQRGPAVSVTSIEYVDPDGALQTLDPSAYVLETDSFEGSIRAKTAWPTSNCDTTGPATVRVTWVAGDDVCPLSVEQAILLMTSHFYEHRSAVDEVSLAPVPLTTQSLLAAHRRFL